MNTMKIACGLLVATTVAACNSGLETPAPEHVSKSSFDRVVEYAPAPGQFINQGNVPATETEAALRAQATLERGGYVSLGAWGGYIVFGFDHPIVNDGGYNLRIGGNSFARSSEPGIVYVMEDTDGNGLPDERWYRLKGSDDDAPATLHDYSVTYYRPLNDTDPVQWSDNRGAQGTIDRISAHPQAYFPLWYAGDSRTFEGMRLEARIEQQGEAWFFSPFDWGYVDNFGSDRLSGGANTQADVCYNHLRIGDAVDAEGHSVALAKIDFVKIQTGAMAQAPAIGELSTEVFSVEDYNLLK